MASFVLRIWSTMDWQDKGGAHSANGQHHIRGCMPRTDSFPQEDWTKKDFGAAFDRWLHENVQPSDHMVFQSWFYSGMQWSHCNSHADSTQNWCNNIVRNGSHIGALSNKDSQADRAADAGMLTMSPANNDLAVSASGACASKAWLVSTDNRLDVTSEIKSLKHSITHAMKLMTGKAGSSL